MGAIQVVKLTPEEQALHDAVCWDEDGWDNKDYDARQDMLDKMAGLATSLLDRGAVPKVRLDSFTDPTMNPGGYGKSRKEVFEKNGTSGMDILRHPHFMKHLRYFIFGPDLPDDTIRGFCQIVEDDRGTSGMVLDQIRAYVRKEVRDRRLRKHDAADEFFKLAHEIGHPRFADSARSAAMSVRD